MTPDEQRICLEVGAEILEVPVLSFVEVNANSHFSTSAVNQGLGGEPTHARYYLCYGVLDRLKNQGRIVDRRPSGSSGPHRWQFRSEGGEQ